MLIEIRLKGKPDMWKIGSRNKVVVREALLISLVVTLEPLVRVIWLAKFNRDIKWKNGYLQCDKK